MRPADQAVAGGLCAPADGGWARLTTTSIELPAGVSAGSTGAGRGDGLLPRRLPPPFAAAGAAGEGEREPLRFLAGVALSCGRAASAEGEKVSVLRERRDERRILRRRRPLATGQKFAATQSELGD
eukprot:COSAG04_NODE_4453_length_2083_cov_2.528226_3_plen_126_part_00